LGPQLGPLENEYPETRFLSAFQTRGSIRVPSRALVEKSRMLEFRAFAVFLFLKKCVHLCSPVCHVTNYFNVYDDFVSRR
jgi:hypothetical protein